MLIYKFHEATNVSLVQTFNFSMLPKMGKKGGVNNSRTTLFVASNLQMNSSLTADEVGDSATTLQPFSEVTS